MPENHGFDPAQLPGKPTIHSGLEENCKNCLWQSSSVGRKDPQKRLNLNTLSMAYWYRGSDIEQKMESSDLKKLLIPTPSMLV
jgi:hypothetical protein